MKHGSHPPPRGVVTAVPSRPGIPEAGSGKSALRNDAIIMKTALKNDVKAISLSPEYNLSPMILYCIIRRAVKIKKQRGFRRRVDCNMPFIAVLRFAQDDRQNNKHCHSEAPAPKNRRFNLQYSCSAYPSGGSILLLHLFRL